MWHYVGIHSQCCVFRNLSGETDLTVNDEYKLLNEYNFILCLFSVSDISSSLHAPIRSRSLWTCSQTRINSNVYTSVLMYKHRYCVDVMHPYILIKIVSMFQGCF